MNVASPVMKVPYNGHELMYAIANDHTAWRVKTMFTKEVDTIAWIEGMREGEHFVDVGANMGIYTIFAASRGLKVTAFEPEAQNYALLCRSIMFNDYDVNAFCLALSDSFRIDSLYLSGYLPGGSCHSFGENVGHRLTAREHVLKQGCVSIPLDQLDLTVDHLKIDVDGFEHKVIAGAQKTLERCESVLVEINTALPQHQELVERMCELGFHYNPEQVNAARRTEGTFAGCGNYIFHR
jgi:FkbM family methyltransferase